MISGVKFDNKCNVKATTTRSETVFIKLKKIISFLKWKSFLKFQTSNKISFELSTS